MSGIVALMMSMAGAAGPYKIKLRNENRPGNVGAYSPDSVLWFDTTESHTYFFWMAAVVGGTNVSNKPDWRLYHTGTTTSIVCTQCGKSRLQTDTTLGSTASEEQILQYTGNFPISQETLVAIDSTAGEWATIHYTGVLVVGASGGRFGLEWQTNSSGGDRGWSHMGSIMWFEDVT